MTEGMIEIEAESLEEARKLLQAEISKGLQVLSEEVVADGEPIAIRATADTLGAALAEARAQVPSNAVIQRERELVSPARQVIRVEAVDKQTAQTYAESEARKQFGEGVMLEDLRLTVPGRKGFLGVGKTAGRYEAQAVRQAVVEVECKTEARIVARLGTSAEALTSNLEDDADESVLFRQQLLSKDYEARRTARKRVYSLEVGISNPSVLQALQASEKLEEAGEKQYLAAGDDLPLDLCREAIRLEPSFSAAHVYLSYLYREYRKMHTLALEWIREALVIEPGNENAWVELGRIHVALGDVIAATEAFQRAIALNPDLRDVEPYARLAIVYETLGMRNEAHQASNRVEMAGVKLESGEADRWSSMVLTVMQSSLAALLRTAWSRSGEERQSSPTTSEGIEALSMKPLIDNLGMLQIGGASAQAAARALVDIGSPAVELLVAAFKNGSERLGKRGDAAVVLGMIGGAKAIDALMAAIEDDDDTRLIARKVLHDVGDAQITDRLLALAQNDEKEDNLGRKISAIYVLGGVGDERAVQPLIAALKDEDKYIAKAAAAALGEIGDSRALGPLASALNLDRKDVFDNARAALVRIGKPAVAALITALKEADMRHLGPIAKTLRTITGQDFGSDIGCWQQWWEENR